MNKIQVLYQEKKKKENILVKKNYIEDKREQKKREGKGRNLIIFHLRDGDRVPCFRKEGVQVSTPGVVFEEVSHILSMFSSPIFGRVICVSGCQL